jgi:hypothetical protein
MPSPKTENDTAEAVETSLDLAKNGDPKATWDKLSKTVPRIEKWSSGATIMEPQRPQAARCKR